MTEIKAVEEQYTSVERVVVENMLTRPAGYELFLTEDEIMGLTTLIRRGVRSDAISILGLKELSAALRQFNKLDATFDQLAKLEGTN